MFVYWLDKPIILDLGYWILAQLASVSGIVGNNKLVYNYIYSLGWNVVLTLKKKIQNLELDMGRKKVS